MIVWIDETMFTRKTFHDKEWSNKKANFLVNQQSLQIKSKAFIGGICHGKGLVHYEIHDQSINKEKFWTFIKKLKKKMKGQKWILYMDNLKVHSC